MWMERKGGEGERGDTHTRAHTATKTARARLHNKRHESERESNARVWQSTTATGRANCVQEKKTLRHSFWVWAEGRLCSGEGGVCGRVGLGWMGGRLGGEGVGWVGGTG